MCNDCNLFIYSHGAKYMLKYLMYMYMNNVSSVLSTSTKYLAPVPGAYVYLPPVFSLSLFLQVLQVLKIDSKMVFKILSCL